MLVHGGPRVHRDDGFRRWGTVSQGAVGPDGVVVAPPCFNHDLGLRQRVEDLAVQQLVTKLRVEAFAISVRLKIAPLERFFDGLTPRATRHDVGGL